MNRTTWLMKMRSEAEELYDSIASLYWDKYGFYSNQSHQQFVNKLLNLVPQESSLLDAACGAGRYFPFLLGKGHTILGIDQSQKMLERAREKFPNLPLEKIGLQDMNFHENFDGAICMDAMEHINPEDWPVVLSNFYRALKPQGYLYFTVEGADKEEVDQAFSRAQEAGLPIVYGEWPDETVYHYYPSMDQVKTWIKKAGFELIEEGEGDGYHHFLMQKG